MLDKLIKDNRVLAIFEYGSLVYGTHSKQSDEDYIVVVDNSYDVTGISGDGGIGGHNVKYEGNDYNFYEIGHWITKTMEFHLEVLECSFLDFKHVIKNNMDTDWCLINKSTIKANKVKTRQRISSVASNSWDKARKKLIVEKDFSPRIAKKSLWHSIRILNYGKQLLLYGYIKDYGTMNYLYDEIVNCPINEWDYYDKNYRPLLLAMRTEFRELSQPEWDEFKGR